MKLAIHGGEKIRNTPFPPRAPYGEDDLRHLREALDGQDLFYNLTNKTAQFEKEFAAMYGVGHCYTCSSGTAAVHSAVAALCLEPGTEVITVPVTDFGTIAGIIYQGLIPVFADWTPGTGMVDPESVRQKITGRTGAIVVVHLFGAPCDMDAIMNIAKEHNLPVIEDCAQAYDTYYHGKLAGTIGGIGCFSMQQSKHLAVGEGGCVITDNDDYGWKMCLFRDKGFESRYRPGPREHTFFGLNYRINELTGAVALSQLGKVRSIVERMRALGDYLRFLLADEPSVIAAPELPDTKHSYWLFPVFFLKGDAKELTGALNAEGLPFGYGYTGKPVYLCMDALSKKRTFGTSGYPFDSQYCKSDVSYAAGLCPVAEAELLKLSCIRIYESWSERDIEDIAAGVKKVLRGFNL